MLLSINLKVSRDSKLRDVARTACSIARQFGVDVSFEYNEAVITVNDCSRPGEVEEQYFANIQRGRANAHVKPNAIRAERSESQPI